MTLDELLRAAAQDVAGQAPDGHVDPAAIRVSALKARGRRRTLVVSGVVAVVVLVTVGLQVLGGQQAAPDPVDPAPTQPTTSPGPGEPVVVVPEIEPDDLRDFEELATVTNGPGPYAGMTDLTFEVTVRDRFAYGWDFFCSGDRDTWYVLIVGDGGGSGSGYCNQQKPQPFPTLPTNLSAFGHSGGADTTLTVRMFVTGPFPQAHQECFDQQSPTDCQDIEPPLEPLASTDVSFGVSVYEFWAPAVAEIVGEPVSAKATVDGADFILSQLVSVESGEGRLPVTLPPSDGDRLVAVVSGFTDEVDACADEAVSIEEHEACLPVLQLRIGDRRVLLERGQFGDFPMLAAPYPFFRVPASGDAAEEVLLRVHSGDPRAITFGLAVFEASP